MENLKIVSYLRNKSGTMRIKSALSPAFVDDNNQASLGELIYKSYT